MSSDRRQFIVTSGAAGLWLHSGVAHAQTMSVQSYYGGLIEGFSVADCAGVIALDNAFAAEAVRSATMAEIELEKEVAAVNSALKRRADVAKLAKDAVQASNVDMALKAAFGAIDLVIAACLSQQNYVCLASTHGVKLVAGAAALGVQAYSAKNLSEQRDVFIAFSSIRAAMYVELVQDLKPKPVHAAARAAIKRATKVALTLSKAGSKVSEAAADLQSAIADLAAFETAYQTALIGSPQFRQFRAQHFEAQRWLLKILRLNYSATNCRVDAIPIKPMP